MRRIWSITAALGLGLCALAATAAGCGSDRDHRVKVIHERPDREGRHENDMKVEHERRGDEHHGDGKRDRDPDRH